MRHLALSASAGLCSGKAGPAAWGRGVNDDRIARLEEPHLLPIMDLIRAWRRDGLDVPNPDPNDGGVRAKAVFLLESPGPCAVGTNFISRDNPDPSARNMKAVLKLAGLERDETFLWNVVPYCVSTSSRNANASPRQVREAAPLTQKLIDIMPDLRAVVLCGIPAQRATRYLTIACRVFKTFHPGLRAYNRPRCREHFHETFAEVAMHVRTAPRLT